VRSEDLFLVELKFQKKKCKIAKNLLLLHFFFIILLECEIRSSLLTPHLSYCLCVIHV
jgi:hypothetical protein